MNFQNDNKFHEFFKQADHRNVASYDIDYLFYILVSPKFSGFSKAATELGLDVEINCLVLSYPPVTSIQFFRGGNLIEPNSKYSFSISEYNVGNRVYQQKRSLKVISVSAEDYGDYRCETTNALGTEFTDIKLIKTSVPDPPTGLVSTNVTWGSVTLSWTAAFDGGFTQAFTAEEITENKLIEGIKETQFTFQGMYSNFFLKKQLQ